MTAVRPENVAMKRSPQIKVSAHQMMKKPNKISIAMRVISIFIWSSCERGCPVYGPRLTGGGSLQPGALPLMPAVGAVARRQRRRGSGADSADSPAQKQPDKSALKWGQRESNFKQAPAT